MRARDDLFLFGNAHVAFSNFPRQQHEFEKNSKSRKPESKNAKQKLRSRRPWMLRRQRLGGRRLLKDLRQIE